jgi:hypothetical protein
MMCLRAIEAETEALTFFGSFSEDDSAPRPEDSMAPLRRVVNAATQLSEAVAREIQDPSEERL